MSTPNFIPFPKMPRLSRECIITEKIDGTNASILITLGGLDTPGIISSWFDEDTQSDMIMLAGSRTRWITPQDDNFGFAAWVKNHADKLRNLGPGHHFGEWWGQGIQRGYGLLERRFDLFNVARWALHGAKLQVIPAADPRIIKRQDMLPQCCELGPVMWRGEFNTEAVNDMICRLQIEGSKAAPGFMKPEGVVVYHIAGNCGFKKTIDKDEEPKGK